MRGREGAPNAHYDVSRQRCRKQREDEPVTPRLPQHSKLLWLSHSIKKGRAGSGRIVIAVTTAAKYLRAWPRRAVCHAKAVSFATGNARVVLSDCRASGTLERRAASKRQVRRRSGTQHSRGSERVSSRSDA